jgi:hypothetical protein
MSRSTTDRTTSNLRRNVAGRDRPSSPAIQQIADFGVSRSFIHFQEEEASAQVACALRTPREMNDSSSARSSADSD